MLIAIIASIIATATDSINIKDCTPFPGVANNSWYACPEGKVTQIVHVDPEENPQAETTIVAVIEDYQIIWIDPKVDHRKRGPFESFHITIADDYCDDAVIISTVNGRVTEVYGW